MAACHPFIRWYPLPNYDIKYRMGDALAATEDGATDENG